LCRSVTGGVTKLESRDSNWNKVSSHSFKTVDPQAKKWLEGRFAGCDKDDIIHGKENKIKCCSTVCVILSLMNAKKIS
jgi:hypothetical protein